MNFLRSRRLRSFAWRLGVAVAVFSSKWITINISLIDFYPALSGLIALMAARITKALIKNSY